MTGRITADEEGTLDDMIRIWKEYCVWYTWVFNQRNRCKWKMKTRTLGTSVSRPQQRNFPLWIGRPLFTTWLIKTNMPMTYLYRPKVSNVTLAPKSRTVLFFAIRALSRHIAEQRSDARVVWKCAQCRKGYLKMHATEGHIPKCKGVVEMPQAFE